MNPPPSAVVSAADIARLAGVRRPAVSNWRRRYPDFPQPVAGTTANPLFSFDEVESWCARRDKPFAAGPSDRLWQRAQAAVDGVRMADFLAHAGLLLAGLQEEAVRLPEADPRWRDLLAEVTAPGGDEMYRRLCARYDEAYGRRTAAVPEDLADLMAALAGADPGSTVLDPACGTGALLLAVARRGVRSFLAQERDASVGYIALTRLLLEGGRARLAVGDAMRHDGFPTASGEEVDVVLCDPPFRDRNWGHEELAEDTRWRYGLPPRGESELAWVQHCLAKVRPGGRVVMLMPAAAARRRTGRRVRANLLRSGALRAVIEPPPPHADAGVHVWLLCAPGLDDRPTHLLDVRGATTPEQIVNAWTLFGQGEHRELGGHGTAIPIIDLLDEETDLLSADRSVHLAPSDPVTRYEETRKELDSALAVVRTTLPRLRPLPPRHTHPVTTIAALVSSGTLELHRAPLTMRIEGGGHRVLTVNDVRNGRSASGWSDTVVGTVVTRAGDVVVPDSGLGNPPLVVQETGPLLGPRLVLLRPVDGRIDPVFLAALLRQEEPERHGSGRSDLRDIRIPILSVDLQRTYGAVLRDLAEAEERLRRIAELGERLSRLGRAGLRGGVLSPEEPIDVT
ncbi:N-6 DNA methylase [Marinactinospora endophytica]